MESLPRNLDFNPSANAFNQLLSHESVSISVLQNMQGGTSIEDSMVITGMQIQSSHMRKLQKGMPSKKKVSQLPNNAIQENSTDTAFRPNKFGLSNINNKTQESF